MTEPDKAHLLQQSSGMEARFARSFLEKHFAIEEHRIGTEIRTAVSSGKLTGEQAIVFCARIATLQGLDIALRRAIDAGDAAGQKLAPALQGHSASPPA